MSKRSKSKRKSWLVNPKQIGNWLDKASDQLAAADYIGVIQTCQRVLRYVPPKSEQRVDALHYIGIAHLMLQNFSEAYEVISEALAHNPDDPDLWYNRGVASRYTMRSGQAVRDFERAIELGSEHQLREKFVEELKFSRKIAEAALQLRGPNFTLAQLIEQEGLFQQGLKLMTDQKWPEAETVFRQVIKMGDCLPQPWGNLGSCLAMQQRYDEAEEAWKKALDLEPNYEHAHRNLAMLPEMRRRGGPQSVLLTEPFKSRGIKKTLTFLKE